MADEEFQFVTHDAIRGCEQIVKLHGWDEATGYLITWWEIGTQSLGDRLKSSADVGLPPDELRRYLFDVAKAIDVINGQGFKHRDIKPDNLLVFRDGGVKVADLVNTKQSSGNYKVIINAKNYNLSDGVYFISLMTNWKTNIHRLVVTE